MNSLKTDTFFTIAHGFFCLAVFIGCAGNTAVISAAPSSIALQYIRAIESDDLLGEEFYIAGHPHLPGVAFPPGAATFVVLDRVPKAAKVVIAAPPKTKKEQAVQAIVTISDPINIAFDSVSTGAKGFNLARLFLWDAGSDSLITVKSDARNVLNPKKAKRFAMQRFGIVNPQGTTVDPVKGRLFILDGDGTRLIAIKPAPGHDFSKASVSTRVLPGNLGPLRGLAFNPANNHLYALNPKLRKLYELTLHGRLLSSAELAGPNIGIPQGMVIAPSLDRTDPSSTFHLYLLTDQGTKGTLYEWALPG